MKRKLFAFDVDGTLLDHKYNEVQKSAIETVRKLKEQGHIVGIATGRNQSQFEQALNPAEFDFRILLNGGYLEIGGKRVKEVKFSQKQKNELCDLFDDLDIEYGISTDHHLYAKNPSSQGVKRVIDTFHVLTPEKKTDLRTLPVFQFSIYEPTTRLDDIEKIHEKYVVHKLGDFGLDVCLTNVNKGYMLEEVAKHFEIDMKDTIAFGDADNDSMLLKEAGIGVAMGNGSENAKKNSDKITTESYNHGIYNAVKELGYIN